MFVEDSQSALAMPLGDESQGGGIDYFEISMRLSVLSDEAHCAAAVAMCEADLRAALSKRRATLAMKRAIDLLGAALGLVVLFLPLVLVGLAIRLASGGPVLFRQIREGRNGHPIRVYKFSTMRAKDWDESGVIQTTPGDPRVTALGRFLRRTSIDELPQLWNVLRGEMSLVGPRAHPVGLRAGGMPYRELCPLYPLRHLVKPGLTGFAQVNGFRGETSDPYRARMRIAHDLRYVRQVTVMDDLKVLAKTLVCELPRMSGS